MHICIVHQLLWSKDGMRSGMRYSPVKEMERWKFNLNVPGCVKSEKRASLQKEQRVRIMFSLCATERQRELLYFYQLTIGCFVVNSTHSSFSSLLTFINDHDSDSKKTGALKGFMKTSSLGNKNKLLAHVNRWHLGIVKQRTLQSMWLQDWMTGNMSGIFDILVLNNLPSSEH